MNVKTKTEDRRNYVDNKIRRYTSSINITAKTQDNSRKPNSLYDTFYDSFKRYCPLYSALISTFEKTVLRVNVYVSVHVLSK